MKILIIGGTGVISTAVTHEALRNGIEVTMINRGNRKKVIPQSVKLIQLDKSDYIHINQLLHDNSFDAVIDFLCFSNKETVNSFTSYSKYTKQYFFISSCAVYNKSLGGTCFEDSPKVLPMWNYSINKWESEKALMKLVESSNTAYTIVRPCITYGDTRIPYGISPQYGYHWTLIARILNDKPIIRWNKGENRVNMMRVEDFAVGIVGLIGNPKSYNEAFNICGDEAPSFNDVLDVLSEILGKKVKTMDVSSEFYAHELPERAGEILGGRSIDGINSNDKIKRIVPSFQQRIFLKEGITMTYNAYKNNSFQEGIDWQFEGDTDRIIKKWCKKQNIESENLNLHFIDYLNNADKKNKRIYYRALNRNRIDIQIITLLWKISKRVCRFWLGKN